MPATEGDAAVILDWRRSGAKADSPKTQRKYLRDAFAAHNIRWTCRRPHPTRVRA